MNKHLESEGWSFVEKTTPTPIHRVLFLPGLWGSDVVFSKILELKSLVDANIDLIAANPPGFKGMPVPPGFDFRIESYADLIEKITMQKKIDLLVGHSFSGNVLIEIAARHRYDGKLMIISPSLQRRDELKDLLKLDKYSRIPVVSNIIWFMVPGMMKKNFSPYFNDPKFLEAVVEDAKKVPSAHGKRTVIGFFDHIDKHDNLANRLVSTKVPVYYVRGEFDDVGFSEQNRITLETNSLIRIFDIPGASHFAMVDKPTEIAGLIKQILA